MSCLVAAVCWKRSCKAPEYYVADGSGIWSQADEGYGWDRGPDSSTRATKKAVWRAGTQFHNLC